MPPEKELKVGSHAPILCKSFPEQAGGLDWLYEDLQRHLGGGKTWLHSMPSLIRYTSEGPCEKVGLFLHMDPLQHHYMHGLWRQALKQNTIWAIYTLGPKTQPSHNLKPGRKQSSRPRPSLLLPRSPSS